MQTQTMQARMKNPGVVIPEASEAITAAVKATYKGGVPTKTLDLIHLRASQINGCSVCVNAGALGAKQRGDTDERIFAVAAWRESPYFTDEERAALALTEAVTRLADRADPVPDSIWDEAARHFDEQGLAAVLLQIGLTNLFNRLNAPTKQIAGSKSW